MHATREAKPVFDAVNDVIGAVSDLIHSFRARAREGAEAPRAKTSGGTPEAEADARSGNRRDSGGESAPQEGLLDRAAKAWHDLRGDAPRARTARRRPASRKARA